MKEILLSNFGKNKGKYIALVDDEDFERVNKFKWSVQKRGNIYYSIRWMKVGLKKVNIQMHCYIMDRKMIDHKDFNGLNNQKENLRYCNNQQNCMNVKPRKNSSSKYKGVSWDKNRKKWSSQITYNYKKINLGYYNDELEAAKAYDEKAKELFKEFAYLNFNILNNQL